MYDIWRSVSSNIPGFYKYKMYRQSNMLMDLQSIVKTICSQNIKQVSHHSQRTFQSSMVTLLMNLRSVRSEGIFVFIKSLANVTLVRFRPLVNSHYVSGSGAGSGEQFGAQFTL